jgi:hypothetical protein
MAGFAKHTVLPTNVTASAAAAIIRAFITASFGMYSEPEAAERAAGPAGWAPVEVPAKVVGAGRDSDQAARGLDPDPVWTADSTAAALFACSPI